MRESICEQIDFILQGGLWEKLTEELAKFTSSALIVEIKNVDVVVIEAMNAELDRLMFKGAGKELLSISPESHSIHKVYCDNFSIPVITQLGEWTNVIRFHVRGENIYVLLKEAPSQGFLMAVKPFLKVIAHWFSLKNSTQLEERLSTLSYMILATKNTLASIFEPMSIDYYAEFLRGVLVESLFPQKIAIYIDDGVSLELLKGDNLGTPGRSGIFASKMISPVPVFYNAEDAKKLGLSFQEQNSGMSIFILPITCTIANEQSYRLFCVGLWEKYNSREILNFMELLGNIASKALEIRHLRISADERIKQLDSRSYTVAALHNVLQKLISYNEKIDLITFLLGFFSETSQADKVKLVIYNAKESKYFLVGESFGSIMAQCFDPLSETTDRKSGDSEIETDESALKLWGFKPFNDMPKSKIYPLWVENKLEGFVAIHNIKCDTQIHNYPVVFSTVCQIAARELYYKHTR
ncbi:MAG: hypothetical protein FWE49_02985 [Synergistaceae bacterium]|nr:hypothetical protein [Synergistaceae bacterium]